MSLKKYLLDKTPQIVISLIGFVITIFMLNAFKVGKGLKIAITIIFVIVCIINNSFDYFINCFKKIRQKVFDFRNDK